MVCNSFSYAIRHQICLAIFPVLQKTIPLITFLYSYAASKWKELQHNFSSSIAGRCQLSTLRPSILTSNIHIYSNGRFHPITAIITLFHLLVKRNVQHEVSHSIQLYNPQLNELLPRSRPPFSILRVLCFSFLFVLNFTSPTSTGNKSISCVSVEMEPIHVS